MNCLERTPICSSVILHDILPSVFSWWSWKEFLGLFSVFSIAKQTLRYFYTTLIWDLTWCSLGVQWWSPVVFLSLQHRNNGLEMTYPSNAEVSVWYSHDLSASCHCSIQELSWILSGVLVLGSCLHPVHEETWSWKNVKEECYPLHHHQSSLSSFCPLGLYHCVCWPQIFTYK